jgi:hypothetical protein
LRGAHNALLSNTTGAEANYSPYGVTAFNANGFSIADTTNGDYSTNGSVGGLYSDAAQNAAWCWDAGSSTVTNTQGSITSQVRANATAGFSVVTYTGNLSSTGTSTVGHGLGVAPSMVITKKRSGASAWTVQHKSLATANTLVDLNSTAATYTSAYGTIVAPTSSVFTIAWLTSMADNGGDYVAYCFAPVAGYSSFGSYTGNGSADGPFVYTNLRPAFVLIKATGAVGGNWMIYDNKRAPSNPNNKKLAANRSLQENEALNLGDDSFAIDFLANGFKIRQTGVNHNDSGTQYIYAAFAEHPFQYARAR